MESIPAWEIELVLKVKLYKQISDIMLLSR